MIRHRDGRCQVGHCGSRDDLQCAHLIGRGKLRTRFEPENAVALCRAHHVYYTHRETDWFRWCQAYLGASKWEWLCQTAQERANLDYAELLEWLGWAA